MVPIGVTETASSWTQAALENNSCLRSGCRRIHYLPSSSYEAVRHTEFLIVRPVRPAPPGGTGPETSHRDFTGHSLHLCTKKARQLRWAPSDLVAQNRRVQPSATSRTEARRPTSSLISLITADVRRLGPRCRQQPRGVRLRHGKPGQSFSHPPDSRSRRAPRRVACPGEASWPVDGFQRRRCRRVEPPQVDRGRTLRRKRVRRVQGLSASRPSRRE